MTQSGIYAAKAYRTVCKHAFESERYDEVLLHCSVVIDTLVSASTVLDDVTAQLVDTYIMRAYAHLLAEQFAQASADVTAARRLDFGMLICAINHMMS